MVTLPSTGKNRVYEAWTDTDDFSGDYDNVSPYLKRGTTIERGRDQGRVIGGPKAPFAKWTLTNTSLLFSTVYTGTPLNGLVKPGHRVRIGKEIGDDDIIGDDPDVDGDDAQALGDGYVEMPLFSGISENPKERYGIGQKQVSFSAYGRTHVLVENKISIPYQAIITTGALVVMALEAAGFTSDQYVVDQDAIDNGRELLHYYADSVPCSTVLRTAWATEGPPAALFEDALGRQVFWGRGLQSFNPRSSDVQVTVVDNPSADTDVYFTDVDYDASNSSVINDMAIEVTHKTTISSAQVWQHSGTLVIANNATVEIFAKNTSQNLWVNVVTPASPTDYTVSAGSLSSVSIEVLSPFTVKITMTAGASGATVIPAGSNTGFSLRAQQVTVLTTEEARGTIDTSDSRALYGDHKAPDELTSSIWPTISKAEADGLVDAYHTAYPEPRELATITLEAGSGDCLYAMMHAEITDRWHIFDLHNGFDHDVLIGQITHQPDSGSQHKCIIIAERIVELDVARFDVGRFDVDRFGN